MSRSLDLITLDLNALRELRVLARTPRDLRVLAEWSRELADEIADADIPV